MFGGKKSLSLLFYIACIAVFLSRCEVKNPVEDRAVTPLLSNLAAPATVFLLTAIPYPVSVHVTDPQGWDDIQTVKAFLFGQNRATPVWEDTLKDDGIAGDVIPRDGIFFTTLTPEFARGDTGTYTIGVVAEDRGDHRSDTLFGTIVVVEGEKNGPPMIRDPVFPDTLTEQTAEDVFLSLHVEDPQGEGDIDSVWIQFYPPLKPNPFFIGKLGDDGTEGDVAVGDSNFSIRANLKDDAPEVSSLVAPTTLSRSGAKSIVLSVQVLDPQGVTDIRSVYFVTTKPDGRPSSGNPFTMYDDGDEINHGDQTAGDGIFSRIITMGPENDLGIYRFDFIAEGYAWGVGKCLFRFQAKDKGGLFSDAIVREGVAVFEEVPSDTLTHFITVVE